MVSADVPRGGLHLWVSLPSGLDDLDISDWARSRQLLVGAGRPYYVSQPPVPRLRLSFSAADRSRCWYGAGCRGRHHSFDLVVECGHEGPFRREENVVRYMLLQAY